MKRLNREQLDYLATSLDSLRERTVADLGERDANYIRSMIRLHRRLEIAGRALIPLSLTPVGFGAGVASLSLAKIIENMEIGHNVMHGQYDWMNDPSLDGNKYEWDTACDGDSWRLTHNYEHHTYTNILGKDRDYGYGLLRLSGELPWRPRNLFQSVDYVLLSVFFQWGVALHELEIEKVSRGQISLSQKREMLTRFMYKGGRQFFKDYVFFPLLTFPVAGKVLAGNLLANLGRNLWSSSVIFCGHFTDGAETFTATECEDESRGHWYYRQLLGSSNFTGGRWLHILSGHLSYQIEHHLFPDIPAHRYPEMAPTVQKICTELGLPYNSGPFLKQYSTVLKRVIRHSFPGSEVAPEPAPERRVRSEEISKQGRAVRLAVAVSRTPGRVFPGIDAAARKLNGLARGAN